MSSTCTAVRQNLRKIAILVCQFKKAPIIHHLLFFLCQDILLKGVFINTEFLFARFSRTKTIVRDNGMGAVKMNATARLVRNGIRMDQFDSLKQISLIVTP
jgi:hypothetical protein